MRNKDSIAKIKSRISDPYTLENFLKKEDINHLILLYNSEQANINSPAVYKNTGPVTLDLKNYITDPVVSKILEKLKLTLGAFEIAAAFFFYTETPHIIHNDDTFELPDSVYKGITIPLKIDGSAIPKLCFFDQFYFHGPAKFFNGSKDIPTYYNKQVYNYADVDGICDLVFDESTRCTYLTHLNPKWLKGLTFWGTLNWQPGNALVFDSTRLHCASDFIQQGIKSKLGISIFTKLCE
jgi:hypothetical protein